MRASPNFVIYVFIAAVMAVISAGCSALLANVLDLPALQCGAGGGGFAFIICIGLLCAYSAGGEHDRAAGLE